MGGDSEEYRGKNCIDPNAYLRAYTRHSTRKYHRLRRLGWHNAVNTKKNRPAYVNTANKKPLTCFIANGMFLKYDVGERTFRETRGVMVSCEIL